MTITREKRVGLAFNSDGSFAFCYGAQIDIERAAHDNLWVARGRHGSRWYQRGEQLIYVEYRNGRVTSAVADDLSKISGPDRKQQIIAILEQPIEGN